MDRFDLTDGFYEDEVREGFYIPAAVKQAFGAELKILNEIDRVCEKYGLKYYATWGTLLGAVRHGGFIPWDDDLDIWMLRKDYDRLIGLIEKEFPKGYAIYDFRTREEHEQFLGNVVNISHICYEPKHLTEYHGFPYIACVDIFILDYIPRDDRKLNEMIAKAKYLLRFSDDIRLGRISEEEIQLRRKDVISILGIEFPDGITKERLRSLIDIEVTKLFGSFTCNESDKLSQMMPWGLKGMRIFNKEEFEKNIRIPFETGEISVPFFYLETAKICYGEYMKIYKNSAGHCYPYFAKQKQDFLSVLDFEYPSYRPDMKSVVKLWKDRRTPAESIDSDSYKSTLLEALLELERINDLLGDCLTDTDELIAHIADAQQLAIDIGTYIESIKGEGYLLVNYLEQYCEALYETSKCPEYETYNNAVKLLAEIKATANKRREVIFLVNKPEWFASYSDEYNKCTKDPFCDVVVATLPYYYKNYDGSLRDERNVCEGYPEGVRWITVDKLNLSVRKPDRIYIQIPYDAWNETVSVAPLYYSDKLLSYTKELVYIPWYNIKDFTSEDVCEYINLENYCCMPGVINSDRVILPSEQMKEVYIKKLTEWAGEEWREFFLDKIEVSLNKSSKEITDNRNGKKLLAIYFDYTNVVLYGDKAIEKIKSSMEIIINANDKIAPVLIKNSSLYEQVKGYYKEEMDRLNSILSSYKDIESYEVNGIKDASKLSDYCDCFYGDGNYIANYFRNAGKPVMIMNYDIV